MPKTDNPTTDDLLAQAEAAEQRAATIRAKAQAAEDKRQQRREAALLTFRAEQLDAHDDEALAAEVRAAHERFDAAVTTAVDADPVLAAYVELAVARHLRTARHHEAASHAAALGRTFHRPTPSGQVEPLPELLQAAVERLIGGRVGEDAAARQAAIDDRLATD